MTVCVAAISDNRIVFGASDRMLTAGDIQFEPTQTKIYVLTNSIAIMVSGDAVLNDEIIKGVERDKSPSMTVQSAAESYRKHYQDIFLRRVEDAILAPLNLNRNTFLSKQKRMNSALVRDISAEMLKFDPSPEGVEVIFTGLDQTGPHIYVVKRSEIQCYDTIGFAAIGSGYWHAQSHLMFAGHTSDWPVPETMLSVYWAKKRAEVAPHVGTETDMFSIAPSASQHVFRFPPWLIEKIDAAYLSGRTAETEARKNAEKGFNEYITKSLFPPGNTESQGAEAESGGVGEPPADGEEDRGSPDLKEKSEA